MAFTPTPIENIIARVKTYVKGELKTLNPTDKNSLIYSLIVAMASLTDDTNKQILLDVIPNSFPITAKTEEGLQKFADLKSTARKQASSASGKATIEGDVGTVIPIGKNFVVNDVIYTQKKSIEVVNDLINLVSISSDGNIAFVECSGNHNFASGITVTIDGALNVVYDGDFVITVTSNTTFQYAINTPTTDSETTEGMTASANIAVLELSTDTVGLISNLSSGDALAIDGEISGLSTSAYVQYDGITMGSDVEDFADWQKRVVSRYQNPITFFNEANIKKTALDVEGVTKVWVYPITPQIGQCTVYFIRGNDANIIPNSTEIAKVKEKVVALRTVRDDGDDIFVYAPTPVTVPVTITDLVPNTPTMKTAIENSLKQLFEDETDLETTLPLDDIKASIRNSFDSETGQKVSSYTLSLPIADVACGTGELPMLGEVQFL